MNQRAIIVIILLLTASAMGFSQQNKGFLEIKTGQIVTVTTAAGFKLPSGFGAQNEQFAVIKISLLRPGVKYQAVMTFEGGTNIGYAMTWVNGNPYEPDWVSFGGYGSGTGSGRSMPGYDTTQMFKTDPKSSTDTIYLVIRANKPWTFTFQITDADQAITRDTKNKYGYYEVSDWTNEGKVLFLLDRK